MTEKNRSTRVNQATISANQRQLQCQISCVNANESNNQRSGGEVEKEGEDLVTTNANGVGRRSCSGRLGNNFNANAKEIELSKLGGEVEREERDHVTKLQWRLRQICTKQFPGLASGSNDFVINGRIELETLRTKCKTSLTIISQQKKFCGLRNFQFLV